ncbi:hypothetical protein N8Z73_01290 [bacterium]|nr:hypothetical protein [bacterium]MDC1221696.1 hypothetical protein [Salibacteraceae bacterium]
MKKVTLILLLLVILVIDAQAQCAMCGAVTEAAQKNGSDVAEGLNAGILYLMGVPYALLIGMGFLLFRKLNQNRAENS